MQVWLAEREALVPDMAVIGPSPRRCSRCEAPARKAFSPLNNGPSAPSFARPR
jgi:hypothetical protein